MNDQPQKKLRRSREDRVFAGVLGGIAEYFGIDPVPLRIGFVILFVLTGFFPFGVLYLLLWLVTPKRE